MELDELIEQYRSLVLKKRVALAFVIGLLPAIYYWSDEGERIQEDLETSEIQLQTSEGKYNDGKRKAAKLPSLLAKINEIETQLDSAKKVLPDKIEISKILNAIGVLEKEYGVTVVKFLPKQEVQPNPQIEYKEVPIDLEISGPFNQTMRFLDSLVHLPNLTHLRNILIETGDGGGDSGPKKIVTKSKLIVFKGM